MNNIRDALFYRKILKAKIWLEIQRENNSVKLTGTEQFYCDDSSMINQQKGGKAQKLMRTTFSIGKYMEISEWENGPLPGLT